MDYYSKNLSILNISLYSDWNLFWDPKIFRITENYDTIQIIHEDNSEVRSADPPI